MLHRQVLVAHVGAQPVRRGQHVPQGPVDARLLAAEGLGQPAEVGVDAGPEHRGLHADASQDRPGDAVGLVQHGHQDVLGRHLGVVVGAGALHRRTEGLLGLERPALRVDGHRGPPVPWGERRLGRVGTSFCDRGTRSRRY